MRFLWWWLWLVWVGGAGAVSFQAPWSADWRLRSDRLSCRLSQPLPHLGEAVFEQSAGEPLTFRLLLSHEAAIVDASVQVRPAPWQHRALPGRRYAVSRIWNGKGGQRSLAVEGSVAERMLAGLFAGRFPAFIYRREWSGEVSEAEVAVSAVRFWEVYDDFQRCRNQLPNYGLKHFRNLRFHFREHQLRLPAGAEAQLGNLADLLRRLGKGEVVVRNAAEGVGGENRIWFRKRYRRVRTVLQQAGIKPEQIVIRATSVRPRIVLTLFGPEGLRLYHYGRHQRRLNAAQKRRLGLLARYVTDFFSGRLVINGYSDGARWRSEKQNRAMAKRWAELVRDYLIAQGVDPGRMRIRVWGSRHRVASNLTKAGQAKNRRVRIDFVEDAARPTPARADAEKAVDPLFIPLQRSLHQG